MKNYFFLLIALISSPGNTQTYVTYTSTQVVQVNTHTLLTGKDVIIKTSADAGTCSDGFWISSVDSGYELALSASLSALNWGSTIDIKGDANERWAGQSGNYCHLYQITF